MSGTKRYIQVDAATGEATEGFVAVLKPKRKSSFKRHLTMNQDTLIALANESTHEEKKVFFALLAELDYENFIQVPQVEIAEMLNMNKTHVSRAMKGLIKNEVIFEGPKVGRSKTYRLNPNFGWKGTVKNHNSALKVIEGGRY